MQQCGFEPNVALMLIPMLIGGMVWLVTMIVIVVALCKIFSKAGYCWALGLLMLVPIANLVMFLVLAFSEWPILKELRALKQSGGSGG